MTDVVIVGAGICGLGTALLLARDGCNVTVLERDKTDPPDSPTESWDKWSRRGVAQFRQPHNFLPGLRILLEEELPHLQDGLRDAGASKFDLLNPSPFPDSSPRSIDDELWTYTARRPVGEWVFNRVATAEPNITVRRGIKVESLIGARPAHGSPPHVTGVRTDKGFEISADLVVDATGRASRTPKWLAELGARNYEEEQTDCGFTYFTRYFSGSQPVRVAPVLTALGTISILTLPGDNDTWSVTVFAASEDKRLKALRDADTWSRVIRSCPLHAHWLDGQPLTDVLAMSGMVDRYRRAIRDGAPIATGIVCVADAAACTNPSAGRGMTIGMIHARCLRDVLRDGYDNPVEFALAFDAVTQRHVAPWFTDQIATDRHRFAEMTALRRGEQPPPPTGRFAQIAKLRSAMMADPDLFRAGLEYLATITPLDEILARESVQQLLADASEAVNESPPPSVLGPKRDELLQLVS
jgi:2-polyprenyl-6-methoxyphenol hydroxylase-like FAD-dependent oxidoreductase